MGVADPVTPFVGGGPGSFGTHAGPGRAASHGRVQVGRLVTGGGGGRLARRRTAGTRPPAALARRGDLRRPASAGTGRTRSSAIRSRTSTAPTRRQWAAARRARRASRD